MGIEANVGIACQYQTVRMKGCKCIETPCIEKGEQSREWRANPPQLSQDQPGNELQERQGLKGVDKKHTWEVDKQTNKHKKPSGGWKWGRNGENLNETGGSFYSSLGRRIICNVLDPGWKWEIKTVQKNSIIDPRAANSKLTQMLAASTWSSIHPSQWI